MFDLQLFAESAPSAPVVPTALGGDEGTPAPQDTNPPTEPQDTNPSAAPETYDYSGALHEIFGENAEMDDGLSNQLSDILHGLGATQDQATAAARFGMTYARDAAQAAAQQVQDSYVQEIQGWGETARQELGGKFDETVATACTTRNYLEQKVPGFTKMLNLTGAGNHIAMIRAMAAMASLVGEDPGHSGQGSGGGSGRSLYDQTDFSKY